MSEDETLSQDAQKHSSGNQERLPARDQGIPISKNPGDSKEAEKESLTQNGSTREGKALPELTGIFKPVAIPHARQEAGLRDRKELARSDGNTPSTTDMLSIANSGNARSNAKGESSFTQMFQALGQDTTSNRQQASEPEVLFRPEANSEGASGWRDSGLHDASPGLVQPNESGGFTSLFRKLGGEFQEDVYSPPPQLSKTPPTPSTQSGGDFTQILRTLSREKEIAAQAPASPVHEITLPQQKQNPGEFTRIISRSQLRDASTPTSEAVSPVEAEAQNAVRLPTPTKSPIGSAVGNVPHEASGSFPELEVPARANSAAPPFPAYSSKLAATASPGEPMSALQRYMPLLLIANLVLMLLILILMGIFLMRH
jgi:hypothetical protein